LIDAASNLSRPAPCTWDSLLNYAPHFVVNWIEVRAVRRPQIWKFIGVTMISEIIALYEWRQRMAHKLQKRSQSEKNLSKPILWYRNVYNQLKTSGKLIIPFISSRRTSRNWW